VCESDIGKGTKIHCTRPDCPFVLTFRSVGPCGVATCRCGLRICWDCKKAAHAPVTCAQQQVWEQVAGQAEDVVQGLWESQNTKECPKCRNRIEKNGGCNHMTCSQCRHQFCWICGQNWAMHKPPCDASKFVDSKYANKLQAVDSVMAQKTIRFAGSFKSHKESLEIETKKKGETMQKLIHVYHAEGLRFDAAQDFALKVLSTIEASRSVLMWSYPFVFFMPDGPDIAIFEHRQAQVAQCIDELTDLVENKPQATFPQIRTALMLTETNTEVLLKF
jgi:ariadne-1